MTYKAMYKCRMCGKEFCKAETTRKTAKADVMNACYREERMREIHYCTDFEKGNIGVADFIGYKEVK